MSFTKIRSTMFQIHMWVGLVLGLFFVLLGLSGSLLTYDEGFANLLDKRPQAVTAGQPLPLSMIQSIARQEAAERGVQGQMQLILPDAPRQAITVRIGGISPMGNAARTDTRRAGGEAAMPNQSRPREGGGQALQLFIDPVSGEVLGTRKTALPGLLIFAHQLHGNFLLGREGRSYVVGPLGLGMCILGLTGLVLWWPRRGQWKYAFKVRKNATGLRFHRELHAATGIWIFLVFIIVSASGLVISWPQLFGLQGPGPRNSPQVEVAESRRLGATEAVIAATRAVPGLEARSITIPARPDQPISVNYLSNGAMNATVLVDPYRGTVLGVRDPSPSFLAWMRPVHQGSLGPVWKFLVFLSGLAPLLFMVTGVIMWLKKRKRRIPMSTMTDDVADADEEDA